MYSLIDWLVFFVVHFQYRLLVIQKNTFVYPIIYQFQ